MDRFNISLAGVTVAVSSRHPYTKEACRSYEAAPDCQAAFTVEATEDQIAQSVRDGALSEGYGEFICLHRQIAEALPAYGAAVLHGAAITYEAAGILFMAPSGTGKSTHIRLWRQAFGQKVDIINGDKPLLRQGKLYGAPWAGKEGWQKNRHAPLKAICLLQQAAHNRIRRVKGKEILPRLMQQVYLPRDPEALQATLALVAGLVEQVPAYILECNMSPEAAQVALDGMLEALV